MNDHEAFMSAIIANPGDDAPRLAYSDWLEDQGDVARAEFIRVQCRIENVLKNYRLSDGSERTIGHLNLIETQRRERELLFETSMHLHPILGERPNVFFWAGAAINVVPDGAEYLGYLEFRRGFVDSISCSVVAWQQFGDEIARLSPLREASLSGPIFGFAGPEELMVLMRKYLPIKITYRTTQPFTWPPEYGRHVSQYLSGPHAISGPEWGRRP